MNSGSAVKIGQQTNLGYDSIDSHFHFLDAFTSRTAILPDLPFGVLGLDFVLRKF